MLILLAQTTLTFSAQSWLLLAAILLIIAYTLSIYRKTNPIVSAIVRGLLISTRILAISCLLLVIFEATLGLSFTRSEPPVLAIAVDNSASMAVQDKEGARSERIRNTLRDDNLTQLEKKFSLKFYGFSDQAQELAPQDLDSLRFRGDVTDISGSLEFIKGELAEENLAGILLLSDGNYNQGGNPIRYASEIGVPIYSIGIGSNETKPDLILSDLEANPFAYVNEPTPLNVAVRSLGLGEQRTTLALRNEQKTISSQIVTIPPSPSEIQVPIRYVPEAPGRQKLFIEMTPIAGEQTIENNKRTVYIDVLKSHLQVLLLAGKASPDISFLRRHLSASDRYEVHTIVEKADGTFYRFPATSTLADHLQDVDLFVLCDFPTNRTSNDLLGRLSAAVKAQTKPVLFILGKETAPQKLGDLQQFLPVMGKSQNANEIQVYPQLSPSAQNHPIAQIAAEGSSLAAAWSQLPPVFSTNVFSQFWPNSEILVYAVPANISPAQKEASRKPLLLVRSDGAQKSAALLAYGIWRWDLLMWGIGNTDDMFSQLVNNLLRWIESTKADELIRIEIEKTNFHYGEPVEIRVEVFDDKHQPVSNAEVKVQLKHEKVQDEFLATRTGDGKYHLTMHPEQPGDYAISVSAQEGNRKLGETTALFSMGEYSKELADLRVQEALLRNVSASSGGKYISADSLPELGRTITGEARSVNESKEIEVWNNPKTLLAIILLLSAEWFVRKRKGMV